MANSNNSVVAFIDSQLPEFIREDNPQFGAFLKAYYAWMESSNGGAQLYHTKNLLSYDDIDTTTDQFIAYFKRDFLPNFPAEVALDERKLVKHAREFYQKSGSVESIQFLFRAIYNKEADIFFPKDQILRASDGKWNLPQIIKLIISPQNLSFDVSLLEKHIGTGSQSLATCIIESAERIVDPTLNSETFQLFIANPKKQFVPGETFQVVYGKDILGNDLIFSEIIVGTLSGISIDPKNPGLRYRGTERDLSNTITYQGDPVSIIGGLGTSIDARKAIAYVGNVTAGGLKSVIVTKGGYGFRDYPNTFVSVIPAPGDLGTGANVVVQSTDTGNSFFLFINSDSIQLKMNSNISDANFGFSNIAISNANTTLANAFAFQNLQFAPLKTLSVITAGGGYTTLPTLSFDVRYNSDYALLQVANTATYSNTVQHIDDLGMIGGVDIISAGMGYSNTRDTIVLNSSIGVGANIGFATDINGAITAIFINNRGTGYTPTPTVRLANSANTYLAASGTGAVLVARAFGDGSAESISVDSIGRILDIRMASKGFDYRSTPNVSLKIQDVTINQIGSNQFLNESDLLYQGANVNAASFVAYVDSYDRPNTVLRLFNYTGTINTSANIVGPTFNVTVNTAIANNITVYGNGKARANANFLSGVDRAAGFWSKTDGFLSWDQRLQDRDRYNNFSYEIAVEQALADYKNTLMNIVHPAGMKMLGTFRIENEETHTNSANLNIAYVRSSNGNVSVVGNTTITGQSTLFLTQTKANDMIVFSPNTAREITRIVSNVSSNTRLTIDGTITYIGAGRLTTINTSNVVVVSGNATEVAANDTISYLNGSNVVNALVVSVSSNNITTNTISVANANNLVYSVTQQINNVSYNIINT